MKKRRLFRARPKEVIVRVSRGSVDSLYQEYAAVLRLRDEVKRAADAGQKSARKVDQS
jgi:hypothetical protein